MKFWNNHPGVKLVIPFVLGIILSIELGYFWEYSLHFCFILIAFVAFLVWSKSFKLRKLVGVLIFLSVFIIGLFYTSFRTEKFTQSHFTHHRYQDKMLVAKVIDNLQAKKNSDKTVLKITQVLGDTILPVSGQILAYFGRDSTTATLEYGDEIIFKEKLTAIQSSRNPNQFDYKNYLNLNQINYQVFLRTKDYQVTGKNKGNVLFGFSQKMRQKLYSYLQENGVEGKQLKVASALLLGYRENLDKDLVKSYASAGAMHVLAVSGLHVGILYLLLSRLLNLFRFLKRFRYVSPLIIISFLWFYAIMTGLSASVMRATTMFTFIVIGDKLINQKVSIYNTLAVSAIILMILNPFIIYQVGFQLSYSAVIGIVYLQPKLNKLIYSRYKIVRAIWAITCVSVAAQIATFPLSLHYFHQFPTYFFISNLVVIPAAFLVFYLGVFLFMIAPFGGLSLVVGKLINAIIWVLNQAVYLTEGLKLSLIQEIELTVFETYLLYGVIIAFLVAFYTRKSRMIYVALSITLVFVGMQLFQQHQSTQQKFITFYSINKHSALEYTSGNSVYFIGNTELQNDWSMMLFNVDNHRNTHNILTKHYLDIHQLPQDTSLPNLIIKENLLLMDSLVIWKFEKDNKPLIEPDYVWITNKNLKGLSAYLRKNKPKRLVFDSSVPNYKYDYFDELIDTTLTHIISLNEKYHKINLSE